MMINFFFPDFFFFPLNNSSAIINSSRERDGRKIKGGLPDKQLRHLCVMMGREKVSEKHALCLPGRNINVSNPRFLPSIDFSWLQRKPRDVSSIYMNFCADFFPSLHFYSFIRFAIANVTF